jgi:hypothetical protein
MATSTRMTALVALLLAAFATPALAGVPSAASSTLPDCIRVVPGGNIVTTIIVRDFASNPISGSIVVLNYSDCAGLAVCPAPGDGYLHDPVAKTISLPTNGVGSAPFYLRAGGGCATPSVRIYADGILLGSRPVMSADQNGDLVVGTGDHALVTSKIGTSDLSGDLDCNGVVDAADAAIVLQYHGNSCNEPTGARATSWGQVKTIYR